jgi:hypothetical protein
VGKADFYCGLAFKVGSSAVFWVRYLCHVRIAWPWTDGTIMAAMVYIMFHAFGVWAWRCVGIICQALGWAFHLGTNMQERPATDERDGIVPLGRAYGSRTRIDCTQTLRTLV